MNMTSVRKAKNPAFGWIVEVFGNDYSQAQTKADAEEKARQIRESVQGMTAREARDYLKV